MRIFELNTQDLTEEERKNRLKEIVRNIVVEQPDTFSLKGAGQSLSSPRLVMTDNLGYVPDKQEHIRIRLDNHALCVAEMLKREGFLYKWTWAPSHILNNEYGTAIFRKN